MHRKDLHTIDPMRPKDWRWKEAQRLVDMRHNCRKMDGHDVWLREAQYFIKRERAIADKLFHSDNTKLSLIRKLQDKHPYLGYAHDMFISSKCIRWSVEAYLLCGESADSIASMVGTSEAVIEYYKKLFFDVEDRLDKPLYISNEILGPALMQGSDPLDYDFFWKLVAYKFGREVFEAVMMGDQGISAEVIAKIDTGIENAARINALKATQTRRVNNFNANEVINEHVSLARMKSDARTGESFDWMAAIVEGSITVRESLEKHKDVALGRGSEYRDALNRLSLPEVAVSRDKETGKIESKD